MFYFKLNLSILILIAFNGLITCTNEENLKNNLNLNKTVEEMKTNVTNLRTGRALMIHPRTPSFTLRRRQPITIRARADHFPLRTQIRRVYNGLPNAQPQQQNLRFSYDSLKSSKYMPSSKVANAGFLNNAKGSLQRPQLLGNHPNSIHVPALSQQYIHNFKASPQFNGQVVVHPVTQKQTTVNVKQDYPKYVKPQQQSATNNAAASQPSLTQYPDFKQYPIPDQEKMQKYNEQHEKYLHQQKYLTPKNPIAYYQLQQQQKQQDLAAQHQTQLAQPYNVQQPQQYLQQTAQLQQPMIPIHENAPQTNNVAFPAAASVPPKMYSVYEDNDMTELQNNNYQTVSYQGLDKEAQEYLRFMNTNEYFLPKKDPNYKQLDEETDKRQYNVLKAQQQQHLYSLQQAQSPYQASAPSAVQTSYEQQAVYAPSSAASAAQTTQYSNSLYADLSDPASYSHNHLYNYEQEPSPSASSTVVRTSYQTGFNQNQIHINSKDNGLTKYSTPKSVVGSTNLPLAYSQLRHNSASSTGGSRTPEPLRFEFTERDAMIGGVTYTRATQTQLRYGSNSVTPSGIESSTVSSLGSKYDSSTLRTQSYAKQNNVKQANEDGDDPEDGDDIEEAGNNLYGRQPVASSDSKKSTSTTEAPPSEQKDTEEYCERICAIVEDENEEIVCGSDGYMYTSEAQMECYASCLHIDVTIQGKGSCSTR